MGATRGAEDPHRSAGSGSGHPRRWPDWAALLPLGVLVVAILVLAAYTTSNYSHIRSLRVENSTVRTPTQRVAQDLSIAIALETEGLHVYTLTGDPVALSDYRRSSVEHRRAAAALRPLARELEGEAAQQARDLLRHNDRWEQLAPDPATLAQLGPEERRRLLGRTQVLYRSILRESGALQQTVRKDADDARSQIDAGEERAWIFTLGLAALALAASLLVLWLVRRVRQLAATSERRRLEAEHGRQEAERRRLEAEAATADRDRLVRGITHDVKNPLGAADGGAQLLEMGVGGSLTQSQRENVRRIRRGIGAGLGIVSDLLDLSRVEAGHFEIAVSPTEVAPILIEVEKDYRFQAEAEGLTLESHIPAVLPAVITSEEKVRQIIGNLLSNAMKFTGPGGRVTLSADIRSPAAAPGRPALAISVADTGPGIAAEEQEKIFGEFYRSQALAARTTGVGLGLSISRRIARLLGGDLTVESEPGQGSEFTLWLPLADAAERRPAA